MASRVFRIFRPSRVGSIASNRSGSVVAAELRRHLNLSDHPGTPQSDEDRESDDEDGSEHEHQEQRLSISDKVKDWVRRKSARARSSLRRGAIRRSLMETEQSTCKERTSIAMEEYVHQYGLDSRIKEGLPCFMEEMSRLCCTYDVKKDIIEALCASTEVERSCQEALSLYTRLRDTLLTDSWWIAARFYQGVTKEIGNMKLKVVKAEQGLLDLKAKTMREIVLLRDQLRHLPPGTSVYLASRYVDPLEYLPENVREVCRACIKEALTCIVADCLLGRKGDMYVALYTEMRKDVEAQMDALTKEADDLRQELEEAYGRNQQLENDYKLLLKEHQDLVPKVGKLQHNVQKHARNLKQLSASEDNSESAGNSGIQEFGVQELDYAQRTESQFKRKATIDVKAAWSQLHKWSEHLSHRQPLSEEATDALNDLVSKFANYSLQSPQIEEAVDQALDEADEHAADDAVPKSSQVEQQCALSEEEKPQTRAYDAKREQLRQQLVEAAEQHPGLQRQLASPKEPDLSSSDPTQQGKAEHPKHPSAADSATSEAADLETNQEYISQAQPKAPPEATPEAQQPDQNLTEELEQQQIQEQGHGLLLPEASVQSKAEAEEQHRGLQRQLASSKEPDLSSSDPTRQGKAEHPAAADSATSEAAHLETNQEYISQAQPNAPPEATPEAQQPDQNLHEEQCDLQQQPEQQQIQEQGPGLLLPEAQVGAEPKVQPNVQSKMQVEAQPKAPRHSQPEIVRVDTATKARQQLPKAACHFSGELQDVMPFIVEVEPNGKKEQCLEVDEGCPVADEEQETEEQVKPEFAEHAQKAMSLFRVMSHLDSELISSVLDSMPKACPQDLRESKVATILTSLHTEIQVHRSLCSNVLSTISTAPRSLDESGWHTVTLHLDDFAGLVGATNLQLLRCFVAAQEEMKKLEVEVSCVLGAWQGVESMREPSATGTVSGESLLHRQSKSYQKPKGLSAKDAAGTRVQISCKEYSPIFQGIQAAAKSLPFSAASSAPSRPPESSTSDLCNKHAVTPGSLQQPALARMGSFTANPKSKLRKTQTNPTLLAGNSRSSSKNSKGTSKPRDIVSGTGNPSFLIVTPASMS